MPTESAIRKAMPPQGRRIRLEEAGGDLVLSYRERPWVSAFFLLVWLTGWTAGCVALVRRGIADPRAFNLLVCLPFLAAWLFAAGVFLWMLFGVEQVRLSASGLEWRRAALVVLSRRTVPRAELKGVRAGREVRRVSHVSDGARRGQQEPCLTFDTLGRPINFALGIGEEEQAWLVERLNDYLDAVGGRAAPVRYHPLREEGITSAAGEILRPAVMPLVPLADTRVALHREPGSVEFVWRGRHDPASMAAMTLLSCFWNGVTALLVCKGIEEKNGGLFLFLMPHQIFGLVVGAMWLMTVTAPAWRLRWTFREREATRRLSVSDEEAIVCDLGWGKRLAVRPPVRIVLQRDERKGRRGSVWELMSHPDGGYALSFLDEEGREMLRINRLNEGDARWMADVLLRAFPAWSAGTDAVVCAAGATAEGLADGRVT